MTNYEYEVVLANGKTFYATSRHSPSVISIRVNSAKTIEFDNALVIVSQVAAVVGWNGESQFGPVKD